MKIMRLSGLPVNPATIDAYTADWQAEFDTLKLKHGNDMLSLQADLAVVENSLKEKHKVIEEVALVKSIKQMKALIDQYQCPIMIAKSAENPEEIVYVICDQAFA